MNPFDNARSFPAHEASVPPLGRHILAQTQGELIVVYQAYSGDIATRAVELQDPRRAGL